LHDVISTVNVLIPARRYDIDEEFKNSTFEKGNILYDRSKSQHKLSNIGSTHIKPGDGDNVV